MTIPSWAMQVEAEYRRGRFPTRYAPVRLLGAQRVSRRAARNAAQRSTGGQG